MDKFIYIQACLASSIIICMYCGRGHDLTSVAQLSVINIADIRSTFKKTLASECFRQNAVDGTL